MAQAHGTTRQGYLWVYLDPQGNTVYYDWQLGRGHDCLLDIIGYDPESNTTDFRGTIQCDGYSAYQALVARNRGIELGGCLAHIRRKFLEADGQAPEVTLPILMGKQKLYGIEEQLRCSKAPPDCRMLARRARPPGSGNRHHPKADIHHSGSATGTVCHLQCIQSQSINHANRNYC